VLNRKVQQGFSKTVFFADHVKLAVVQVTTATVFHSKMSMRFTLWR